MFWRGWFHRKGTRRMGVCSKIIRTWGSPANAAPSSSASQSQTDPSTTFAGNPSSSPLTLTTCLSRQISPSAYHLPPTTYSQFFHKFSAVSLDLFEDEQRNIFANPIKAFCILGRSTPHRTWHLPLTHLHLLARAYIPHRDHPTITHTRIY